WAITWIKKYPRSILRVFWTAYSFLCCYIHIILSVFIHTVLNVFLIEKDFIQYFWRPFILSKSEEFRFA
ncbi:unnamed protein product, partial [Bubo scandiacus]